MSDRTDQEGRAADVLTELIEAFGAARVQDADVVRGLLNDHLGTESVPLRREVKLLTEAAAEGVPGILQTATSTARADATARMVALGTDPGAAQWAIEAWGLALGLRSFSASEPAAPLSTVPSRRPNERTPGIGTKRVPSPIGHGRTRGTAPAANRTDSCPKCPAGDYPYHPSEGEGVCLWHGSIREQGSTGTDVAGADG
jgi:hypothetical protein